MILFIVIVLILDIVTAVILVKIDSVDVVQMFCMFNVGGNVQSENVEFFTEKFFENRC